MNDLSLSSLLPNWDLSSSGFFYWDSWSQLFILLILGIGLLVAIHAWGYFKDFASRRKFFSVFLPFAVAMLGVVTLNHVILIFICWELTSLLSYFLISFKGESPEARGGGQQSLLITGAGGLSLMGGFLLLGATESAWTLSQILQVNLAQNPYGGVIAGLILAGVFTKSAQFPFHFWLSGAMTAPTPASAYLHSATMVKAGVFLLFRLWPVLGELGWVDHLVFTVGMITFAWGSFSALLQLDLKGVLAGTTVAHLGLMCAMIAWKGPALESALYGLVLAHAIYKAGLFLFSGVIEKLSGTRRLDEMNGLRGVAPRVFWIGVLLAGASLGLPGTLAYHAKSLMHLDWAWKIALTIGFLLLGKAGMLVAVRPFLGPISEKKAKSLSGLAWMFLPPLVLGVLSWVLGPLLMIVKSNPFPLPTNMDWSLKSLSLSLISALVAISLLIRWSPKWAEVLNRPPWPRGSMIFDRLWNLHLNFAKVIRQFVQCESLGVYILTVMAFFAIGIFYLFGGSTLGLDVLVKEWAGLSYWDVFVWLCGGIILATLYTLRAQSGIRAVLYLGLVGYLIAVVLALAGAPDLAMTQFAVESLSILVLLYALKGVGPLKPRSMPLRVSALAISLMAGVAVTLAVGLSSTTVVNSRLRDFFAQNSYLEAHGRNVVNVILVDFRAFDTMGEITVLSIVTLGIFVLLATLKRRSNP